MAEETQYVDGLPSTGIGDGGEATAYGVVVAMKTLFEQKYGNDSLKDKIIAVQGVGSVGSDLVRRLAEEGAEASAGRWLCLQQPSTSHGGRGQGGMGRRPGQGLVLAAGEEDPESPDTNGRTGPGLQAQFAALVDQCVVEGLHLEHAAAESWPDVRRLKDLSDKGCNHYWL